ncbi:unnamed protein product [Chondrus crispus]|uniref:Uncharacterized protein n=1 Tax=Chondrus crispus TaxID=2769 RepID=R7Q8P8_CHOCR|nr:unnamed protein product [Chondrus crispus]CDF33766.1 unnamed protein product [Chondrus crispus]|eukprot:XP_005713585.1 unnamed protein product [Chondrus crispus]
MSTFLQHHLFLQKIDENLAFSSLVSCGLREQLGRPCPHQIEHQPFAGFGNECYMTRLLRHWHRAIRSK